MFVITKKSICSCFNYLCLLIAFVLTVWCLLEYSKNSNITEVSYQYFDSKKEENQYPALTLCFLNAYKDADLKKYNDEALNGTSYSEFLSGRYWNEKMMEVDYNSATIDIHDFIIGTCITTTSSPDCHKIKQITSGSYIIAMNVFKCFTFHHDHDTSAPLDEVMIALNNSIFPNNVRPSLEGRFLLTYHYPHQVLTSLKSMMIAWPPRIAKSYYIMNIHISGIEILKRRKGGEEVCYDWKNYDLKIREDVMKSVGCQPPYWKSIKDYTDCGSKNQLREIVSQYMAKQFHDSQFQKHVPPCIEIKKIQMEYREQDIKESKSAYHYHVYQKFEEIAGSSDNWFIINSHLWKSTDFKEIKQLKAFTLQSLIGNAGGYIGLLVGITISQLPHCLFKLRDLVQYGFMIDRNI